MRKLKKYIFLFLFMMFLFSRVDAVSFDYGYNSLNENERKLYEKMENSVAYMEDSMDFCGFSGEDCFRIFLCFLDDHPEIFWVERRISVTSPVDSSDTGTMQTVEFSYSHYEGLRNEKQEFDRKVEELRKEIKKETNDWFKLLRIYEAIASSIVYDEDYMSDQTVWSTLIQGRGVCAGIARLFQYLALMEGIPCVLVRGYGIDSEGAISPIGHIWCMAEVLGKWYHFDPTWAIKDKGEVDYTYFCRSDDFFSKTRIIERTDNTPTSGSDILSYASVRKRVLEDYDRTSFTDVLVKAWKNGEGFFSVEFSTEDALERAMTDLFVNVGIFEILKNAGCYSSEVSYSVDFRCNTLTISFSA